MAHEAGVKVTKVLAMIEATKALEDDLYSIIRPMVAAYMQRIGYIEDVWASGQVTQQIVTGMMTTLGEAGAVTLATIGPKLEDWATDVERWHRRRWAGVVKGATRLDIEPIMAMGDVRKQVEAATMRNVAYITKLDDDIRTAIEARVAQAYQDGTNARQLAKSLREDLDFAPKRARLIASDQMGKYSGSLDKARHTQAGLDRYKWRTVGDDRVRPKHVANNNKVFTWGKPPPSTGEPGQDIRCRCKAQAIIYSEAEEAEFAAEGLTL